jgi:hypothetical protein
MSWTLCLKALTRRGSVTPMSMMTEGLVISAWYFSPLLERMSASAVLSRKRLLVVTCIVLTMTTADLPLGGMLYALTGYVPIWRVTRI